MGKVPNNQQKKGGGFKWVQVLLSPDVHRRLRQIALDKDYTLAYLLRYIIETFLKEEK